MRTLVFGSFNLDHIYRVSAFVGPGETRSPLSVETVLGGKGFNQAVAAARAGLNVSMAGDIGSDGTCFLDKCRENGIDARYVSLREERTGSAVIQVNDKGENCILLYGGANRRVTAEQVDVVMQDFSAGDVLILQNEINELDYITLAACRHGLRICLNPSPIDEAITPEILSRVNWLFVNEKEAEQLCGTGDTDSCLKELRQLCPAGTIILTLGENGSYCTDGERTFRQNAFSVPVVDTTGAGDTFTGFYMSAALEGKRPDEALLRGSRAAALAVGRKGAYDSIPFREELEIYFS